MTSTDDLTLEVIKAVAKSDAVDPAAVDFTLSDYLDPEVLAKLEGMESAVWEFTFRVSDHQVQITHNGTIFVDGVIHDADTAWQK